MADETAARKRWELENNIQLMELDEIFKHDTKAVGELLSARPWKTKFVHHAAHRHSTAGARTAASQQRHCTARTTSSP